MTLDKRIIKWGIMGPGWISKAFAADLAHAERAELTAVGSRSPERAEAFAREFNVKRAYGSYEELVRDPEVDIIYIGTPHPAHRRNVLACLQAGKAVLCEKPFTLNAEEAAELVRVAREKKLFLMEAMWTRFLPAIGQIKEWLQAGRIGEVRLVKADFGFDAGWHPESRLLNKELGGGALLDAGIYPVSFASLIYGEQPANVMSCAHIGETGVDEQFSALLAYSGGRTAALNGAVRLQMPHDAYVFGTKGHIHVPGFLYARSANLHVHGEEPVAFTDDRTTKGYIYEAEAAMACLREGRMECEVMPLAETVQIMRTMDAIRAPWNLRYPME